MWRIPFDCHRTKDGKDPGLSYRGHASCHGACDAFQLYVDELGDTAPLNRKADILTIAGSIFSY